MRDTAKRVVRSPEERLEMLKKAASRLFFVHGYEGTNLRQIARELDMHAGSLYNHIESKEELLYLIMREGMVDVTAGLERALDGLVDPLERLRAAIEFHLVHQMQRRYVAWTNHVEVRALGGKRRAEILALRDAYQAQWVQLVEAGVDSGVFRPVDARIVAYGMLSLAQGLSRWFNPRGRLSAEEIAREYVAVFMQGLIQVPAHAPASDAAAGDGHAIPLTLPPPAPREPATGRRAGIRSMGTLATQKD